MRRLPESPSLWVTVRPIREHWGNAHPERPIREVSISIERDELRLWVGDKAVLGPGLLTFVEKVKALGRPQWRFAAFFPLWVVGATRNDVIDRLNEIIVVPATGTIRGLTTEVILTPDDGMPAALSIAGIPQTVFAESGRCGRSTSIETRS